MSERDTYVAELIRLDGCGDYVSGICGGCHAPALSHCLDCDDLQLYCHECTVSNHVRSPTHRIQEWTGEFFQDLGHPAGQRCILPRPAFNDEFILIDINGIHEVGLDFCGCETSNTHVRQLLRHGWFPSTSIDPRTAATFRLLRHFQILSFESKASAYEYYHSLVRLTDNTGLSKPKDRYNAFMRMVREWHHLKMLKRFGRGHEASGVEGTSQGECVVICLACPQPGINLPDGWEHATKDKQWLYATFVAIDANFRLKRRNMSTNEADPSLSKGWSYFVEEADYKSYLAEHLGEAQECKSTCSSHNAVNMADTKLSQGLAATGVGTIDCARHNMKRGNGVGDLQKGEKYINMDYLFFSTLRNNSLKILNVSYDIACQWHKHIWSHMESLPQSHHLNHVSKTIRFFVPKFHLPVHVAKCQSLFSFNFTRFIGRMDGEAQERGWSNINPVASSMKNMGPGCCRDTLDDHFGDWNWKKVVGLGASLLNKMKDALVERAEHQAAFDEFDAVISIEHRATWLSEMVIWEQNPNDMSVPNPLEMKAIAITQAGVQLRLAELEANELERGIDVLLHPEVSLSVLIVSGLDLEEEHIVQMRNSLCRKIETWGRVQILYMPAVLQGGRDDQHNAEDIIPLLPSWMKNKPCDQCLQNNEWELHYAQAYDALEELRQCLIHCSLLTFKCEWVRGQGANTQAQNALTRVHARRTACVKRYRSAWTALKALATLLKKRDWKGRLQELANDHIKPLVDLFGVGEGRRQVSWIWMMEGIDCNGDCDDDRVRIEWCKSRARALRWTEEVELLMEEMGRVIQFLHWDAQHWDERRSQLTVENPAHTEGLHAYAVQQAHIRRRLAAHFHALWAPYLMPTLGPGINTTHAELSLPDLTMPNAPLMDADGFCDNHT
ncbi:hypothetical protein EV424DRAFT_1472894 [Suillus variegatus]|nr:hypothetical protein EV424DRAFT_1472894 [Suillus variegatus]